MRSEFFSGQKTFKITIIKVTIFKTLVFFFPYVKRIKTIKS